MIIYILVIDYNWLKMHLLTFKELQANFDKFIEIFRNASQSPFLTTYIDKSDYLYPEQGFIAKIVLCPPNSAYKYDLDRRDKNYTVKYRS